MCNVRGTTFHCCEMCSNGGRDDRNSRTSTTICLRLFCRAVLAVTTPAPGTVIECVWDTVRESNVKDASTESACRMSKGLSGRDTTRCSLVRMSASKAFFSFAREATYRCSSVLPSKSHRNTNIYITQYQHRSKQRRENVATHLKLTVCKEKHPHG